MISYDTTSHRTQLQQRGPGAQRFKTQQNTDAKKKAARGKPSSGSPASDAQRDDTTALTTGINADVWVRHLQNYQKVMGHPIFGNIEQMQPFGISNRDDEISGFQEAFDKKKAAIAMTRAGKYKCAVNLAWVNTFYTSSENVPVMWSSVEDMVRQHFSIPASMPDNLTVTSAFTDLK